MMLLANLFGIGRATIVKDDGDLQLLQVTEGATGTGFQDRVSDNVPRVAEFGFASAPPIDAEVLMLNRGGQRSQAIAIATSHRPSRPKNLEPGDAGIYDVRGAKVMLTADGLVIDCAGLPAVIQNASTVTLRVSSKVRVEGDLEVTGDLRSRADATPVSLNSLRDAYHAHKHTGVQTGSGSSGLTDHDA